MSVQNTSDGIKKNIELPYLSQTDNKYEPYTACNITCVAMCLKKFGIVGDGSEAQLEDQLYNKALASRWNRFSPQGIKSLIESYGLTDRLNTNAGTHDIYKSLDEGRPVIAHGFFTDSGHIIVIKGHTEKGHFLVNDPYGDLIANGWYYEVNDSSEPHRGENLIYSKWLIGAACGSWSSGEAKIWYKTINHSELMSINNMWIHSVGV
ncbi:C39 family peptidase [Okeania sp. SIO2B9]|uniref:C39 family peptidase n=1 Tax=Okeania sp. SIO2B9 TaxID=2607782 RepID=UPI00142C61DE|nr:C39 family peptidase [Okeania sp. SIO2B9]NES93180.1 hypothetical protein [Okeania sp. SIO2B9]